MFLNQALFIVGVDLSGAVVASCIQPSQPIVTFGIAVLTGQETLDFNRCVGLGFAVVGAVWVVVGDMIFSGKSAAEVGKNSILGDCCLIANCVAMGFCYVTVKQLSKTYSPVVVIAWIYAYAAFALVFAAAFFVPASSAEVSDSKCVVLCACATLKVKRQSVCVCDNAIARCLDVIPFETPPPPTALTDDPLPSLDSLHECFGGPPSGSSPGVLCRRTSTLSLWRAFWVTS